MQFCIRGLSSLSTGRSENAGKIRDSLAVGYGISATQRSLNGVECPLKPLERSLGSLRAKLGQKPVGSVENACRLLRSDNSESGSGKHEVVSFEFS